MSAYQQMVAATAPHELALHNYVKISNWCPSLSVKTICLNRAGKALLRWTKTINSGSLRIGAINWANVPDGLWIVHSRVVCATISRAAKTLFCLSGSIW